MLMLQFIFCVLTLSSYLFWLPLLESNFTQETNWGGGLNINSWLLSNISDCDLAKSEWRKSLRTEFLIGALSSNALNRNMCNSSFQFYFYFVGVDGCALEDLMCEQRCDFSAHGYKCSCARGYRLADNQQDCVGEK